MMETNDRPCLHALVAYFSPGFGLLTEPKVLPLDDAMDYRHYGFTILVDPMDERDLATWERYQRATQSSRKWWDR